jgi:[ribosomal protein S18]-alanine N-acetyltransferase
VVAGTADVQRVVVDPAARRQGWGTRVLSDLVAIAEACGCTEIMLEVSTDNDAARRLYQRAGFAEIARRPGYYRSGGDALVLRRPVHPGGM